MISSLFFLKLNIFLINLVKLYLKIHLNSMKHKKYTSVLNGDQWNEEEYYLTFLIKIIIHEEYIFF